MMSITFLFSALVLLYFTNPAIASWDTYLLTAYYPPLIRVNKIDIFIYLHQIVVMCHCSVIVNLDATVVLLIYICTVQLKILADDFQQVTHPEKLKKCISEHQHTLGYLYLLISEISYFFYKSPRGIV